MPSFSLLVCLHFALYSGRRRRLVPYSYRQGAHIDILVKITLWPIFSLDPIKPWVNIGSRV